MPVEASDIHFWVLCSMIWQDHPMIFVLLAFWLVGLVGCKLTQTSSFFEFWFYGLKPRNWKKKQRSPHAQHKTSKTLDPDEHPPAKSRESSEYSRPQGRK